MSAMRGMVLDIEGLEVFFPYPYMYPEQYKYMAALRRTVAQKAHGLLEMPTGTGKTVCLLSLLTSIQIAAKPSPKLIYCTRTVQEMDKVVEELKRVITHRDEAYREKYNVQPKPILAVCLSSRRNLCVHPEVSQFENREKVDALCRDRTAPWVRQKSPASVCTYYSGFEQFSETGSLAMTGILSLDDIREFGKDKGICPYFLVRQLISVADIVVYNYQYLIDPKISGLVSKDVSKDAIVVFDEGHNIDNICIEALSIELDKKTIQNATGNLKSLNRIVRDVEAVDAQRLKDEYEKLVRGLGLAPRADGSSENKQDIGSEIQASPLLTPDILKEAVPGNIRRAKHFLMFLMTIVQHFKVRLSGKSVEQEEPIEFLAKLEKDTNMMPYQTKALKFAHDRLQSLLRTLQITNLDEYTPLQMVANFATLVSSYSKGFAVILEPYNDRAPGIPDPRLQLACLDASVAMKPIIDKFGTVVITSGTMSPIDLYPKLLNFNAQVIESFTISTSLRQIICPIIVAKGNDQVEITSRFEKRNDQAVVSNYGRLLVDMASIIPDGIVCFFTSYAYMESILTLWNESGILREALQHKLIFIETQDIVETSLALDSFKKACDSGRGAIFFSIARGKVSEGIDFDRHYGRCVILYGVPFQYTLSKELRARLQFLKDCYQIQESEFLSFDALRQAAQCVGRVIRSKMDYGVMIFADVVSLTNQSVFPVFLNFFLAVQACR
jgi:DNA excision repair protein ERCC-2